MTPTPKLRYVARNIIVSNDKGFGVTTKTVRILQQWWEDKNIVLAIHITDRDGNTLLSPNRGEWRDVPIEQEQA